MQTWSQPRLGHPRFLILEDVSGFFGSKQKLCDMTLTYSRLVKSEMGDVMIEAIGF